MLSTIFRHQIKCLCSLVKRRGILSVGINNIMHLSMCPGEGTLTFEDLKFSNSPGVARPPILGQTIDRCIMVKPDSRYCTEKKKKKMNLGVKTFRWLESSVKAYLGKLTLTYPKPLIITRIYHLHKETTLGFCKSLLDIFRKTINNTVFSRLNAPGVY